VDDDWMLHSAINSSWVAKSLHAFSEFPQLVALSMFPCEGGWERAANFHGVGRIDEWGQHLYADTWKQHWSLQAYIQHNRRFEAVWPFANFLSTEHIERLHELGFLLKNSAEHVALPTVRAYMPLEDFRVCKADRPVAQLPFDSQIWPSWTHPGREISQLIGVLIRSSCRAALASGFRIHSDRDIYYAMAFVCSALVAGMVLAIYILVCARRWLFKSRSTQEGDMTTWLGYTCVVLVIVIFTIATVLTYLAISTRGEMATDLMPEDVHYGDTFQTIPAQVLHRLNILL
jgi:hypothetical protein